MTSIEDLKKLTTPAPKDFTPGIVWDGDTGHVTMATRGEQPSRDEVDRVLDTSPFLNSDEIQVDWTARPRVSIQHDDQGNLRTAWYKLPLMRRIDRSFEVQDLLDNIHETPLREDVDYLGWRTIVVTDAHIGKAESAGGGSEKIAERWMEGVDAALDGYYAGVNIVFGGDLIEGYVSQGGRNINQTDLTLMEQMRVAQHLVSETIQTALDHAEEVVVSTVPGNHGESTRVQGVPMGDSYDLQIVSNVQQAFKLAGIMDVTFYYPEDNCGDVTYRAGDDIFTIAHGHLFKGQMSGAQKWWQGQTMSERPPAHSKVLVAGHFHNMQVANVTRDKWVMFGPSLETESTWFVNKTGTTAQNGVLAFDMINGTPMNIGVF